MDRISRFSWRIRGWSKLRLMVSSR